MAWEENSRICLHMQLIAILSRIVVIDNQLLVLFLLLRESTFFLTAEKRNDKKCNFASENLIT